MNYYFFTFLLTIFLSFEWRFDEENMRKFILLKDIQNGGSISFLNYNEIFIRIESMLE